MGKKNSISPLTAIFKIEDVGKIQKSVFKNVKTWRE